MCENTKLSGRKKLIQLLDDIDSMENKIREVKIMMPQLEKARKEARELLRLESMTLEQNKLDLQGVI